MTTGRKLHSNLVFNMAPMIDVVFQLIIFFTLVSNFASAERVRMDLPNPEKSLAKDIKIVDRVMINCRVAPAGSAAGAEEAVYSIGPNRPEPLAKISQRLAAARDANPLLKVVIRADKRLRYEEVRAAMEVVADNQIENMSLVAHVGGVED